MALKPLNCPNCGGKIDSFDETVKKCFCPYCDTIINDVQELQEKFKVEIIGKVEVEGISNKTALLKRAAQLIEEESFYNAKKIYKRIIDEIDPESHEAWWGIVCIGLDIELVDRGGLVQFHRSDDVEIDAFKVAIVDLKTAMNRIESGLRVGYEYAVKYADQPTAQHYKSIYQLKINLIKEKVRERLLKAEENRIAQEKAAEEIQLNVTKLSQINKEIGDVNKKIVENNITGTIVIWTIVSFFIALFAVNTSMAGYTSSDSSYIIGPIILSLPLITCVYIIIIRNINRITYSNKLEQLEKDKNHIENISYKL